MPREETATHLFLLGDEATKIWERGKTLLDLPLPRTFNQIWDILMQLNSNMTYMDGLRIIWVCCSLWELWVYRNKRIHDGTHHTATLAVRGWIHRLAPLVPL
ncbi:hypothetical protein QQ045_014591 [Rhodiola kirilowii]